MSKLAFQRRFALVVCLLLAAPGPFLSCRHAGIAVAAKVEEASCDANGVCTTVLECQDNNEACPTWSSQGECDAHPAYMLKECRKSCYVCGEDPQVGDGSLYGVPQTLGNSIFYSSETADQERLTRMGQYMQQQESAIPANIARERLTRMGRYMQKESKELPANIQKNCRNLHADCINWAVGGECDGNPIWMKQECAPACLSCDFLVYVERCPMDKALLKDVWGAGDLNKMFEKLTSEPYLSQYSIEILSSPATTDGPWVIQLDNVLSPSEAEQLIELGEIEGFARSGMLGKLSVINGLNDNTISDGRTSSNTWCRDNCYRNETALAVIHRLSNLTGVPESNSEHLQMLCYEPGQYYESHHDYIRHHVLRQPGPRILTFYLYLNDVEAGGGTEFDKLGLVVTPKVGRAILWPSVLDQWPMKQDDRTMHAALAVEKGIKYGVNAWFHLRNFKEPLESSCI